MFVNIQCALEDASGEVRVEVVAPDTRYENYSLKEVVIPNVESIKGLIHEDYTFLSGGLLKGDEMQRILSNENDPVVFAAKTRASFRQQMQIDLVKTNQTFSAKSFDSLLALSAFAGVQQVWDWYRHELNDVSDATATKGYVVFYGDIVPSNFAPIPMVQMDNAVYLAGVDVWMVFPVGSQEGVPYAMNHGVLAHEFHHRVFFQSVWAKEAFERWKTLLNADESLSADEQRSLNILRALDEGLADINAIGFTRNVRFMNPSFESIHLDVLTNELLTAESERRNIESDFLDLATYDNLATDTLEHDLVSGCGRSNDFKTTTDIFGDVWSPYCLGSVIARTLWDGAQRDFEILNQSILPSINQTLPILGAEMAMGNSFDLDLFFNILLDTLPDEFDHSILCEHIQLKFTSLTESGRIPKCVN